MNLPTWILNCFCAFVGAALTMSIVTACSSESGQEPKALAYGLYAFLAAFVVLASHEHKFDGASDRMVKISLVLFILATVGGGVSFYAQVFWPWGIAMMLGIMALLPLHRSASRVY